MTHSKIIIHGNELFSSRTISIPFKALAGELWSLKSYFNWNKSNFLLPSNHHNIPSNFYNHFQLSSELWISALQQTVLEFQSPECWPFPGYLDHTAICKQLGYGWDAKHLASRPETSCLTLNQQFFKKFNKFMRF